MKRFILIVTGAVGSLFAILSITPPQFGTGSALGTGTLPGSASVPAATPTPVKTAAKPVVTSPQSVPNGDDEGSTPTKKATVKATPKATKKTTAKATPSATKTTAATTPSSTPTPVATKPAPATSGVSGTFTGATYDAREPNGQLWGSVTVTIVLKDGKIVSSTGSQSPSSRGPYAFTALDPFFKSNQMSLAQIKAESASKVVADSLYVSRVTYSSLAYWSSIKSALSKAGI